MKPNLSFSNSVFKFKQFSVYQCNDVFAIGTDAVILGACLPLFGNELKLLEVGTGTGVVSLMIAQRKKFAVINACDINVKAVECASTNFNNSIFNKRLSVVNQDFTKLKLNENIKFNHVFSNPPFFEQQNKLGSKSRDFARNSNYLNANLFLKSSLKILDRSDGLISVIIPSDKRLHWIFEALAQGLYLFRELKVYSQSNKLIRVLLTFSILQKPYSFQEIILRDKTGRQTKEFAEVTNTFLL